MTKGFRIFTVLLAIALVFSLVGCNSSTNNDVFEKVVSDYYTNMTDVYKISQADFVEKVKANEDMFVLDIRQADAYAEGHVKGAVNAPWGTAISENLDKLPMSKTIMVYCYSGQTAGQTVALLNMAGFDAKSVNLGWNFGISKVEGVEDITETTANEFGQPTGTEIDSDIKEALDNYFSGLKDVKETTYANYKISEDNLAAIMDAEEDFYLLSIRSAADFAEGHIQGAENIPWGAGMEKQFSILPTDKKIVVYCYSGQTAGQTVAGLKLLGYDAVSLNGGIGVGANAPLGWINQEYETVK